MEPGRILADRYEIVAPIAEGAMSTVWEARDGSAGGVVAVKAVSMEKAGWRAEVRDRFQQEARLLTLVDDPHLVGVREVGETDDGFLYLVLERLTGETLAARLARPPALGWRAATAIALDLARGLATLHERGIVHRDLKPANVILHESGGASGPVTKIIDLGISKVGAAAADPVLFATLTSTGQVLGTPAYMSYEQAIGQRDVDARTDVWALGVVLHEMLAGQRPFEGDNVNAVLARIRGGAPPSLARFAPAAVAGVVERCLSRDRAVRFAGGGELAAALEAALREGEREHAAAARRRWLLALGGAAIAAAVAGLLVKQLATAHVPAPVTPVEPVVTVSAALPAPPSATETALPRPADPIASSTPSHSASSPPPAVKSARPLTQVNSAGF